jgi:hypothetical protein
LLKIIDFPRFGSGVEARQPFGKAALKNTNSYITQPNDLIYSFILINFIRLEAKKFVKKQFYS